MSTVFHNYATLINCSCTLENNYYYNDGAEFKIIANEGYKLPDKRLYYYIGNSTKYFTVDENGWVATANDTNYSQGNEILINQRIECVSDPTHVPRKKVKISATFTNCSCNYKNNESIDPNKPIIIKANEGYDFTNVNSYWCGYALSDVDFIKTDNSTFTLDTTNYTEFDLTINKNLVATKTVIEHTIHFRNLTNCSSNYNEGDVLVYTKPIKIIANEGYEFNGSDYSVVYNGILHKFTVVSNTELSLDITNLTEFNIEVKEIIATEIPEPIVPKVVITGSFINCSCNYSNEEPIDKSKNLIITASKGYEFKGKYTVDYGAFIYTLANTGNQLILDTSELIHYYDIEVNQEYNATLIPVSLTNIVNVYKVNNEILNQLSSARFVNEDTTKYITDLYYLPFTIPDKLIGSDTNIILGGYDTKVKAPLLLDYLVSYSLGKISVPLKYNNVYDYINTECILHLPFTEPINVKPCYCINQTTEIIYTINLYSGQATINLISSFTNKVFNNYVVSMCQKLPYILKTDLYPVSDFTFFNNNNIFNAYYEIIRNTPVDNDRLLSTKNKKDYLKNYRGLVNVKEINLNTIATKPEQTEIINLLQDKIYINEVM